MNTYRVHDCPWISDYTEDHTGLVVGEKHMACDCASSTADELTRHAIGRAYDREREQDRLNKQSSDAAASPAKTETPVEASITGYFTRMVTNATGSETYEEINHPDHYTKGIETSKYIRSWSMDFHTGNIIKYVTRAPYKGKYLSDLKKARWYLERLIEEAENAADPSRQ